jgi:hypothetical protein
VPDETHNADGRHIGYLSSQNVRGRQLATLDAELYNGLASLVASGARNIGALEDSGLFPRTTVTFGEPLTLGVGDGRNSQATRLQFRSGWSTRAAQAMLPADLVFVDPDNGVRSDDSLPRHHPRAAKYAYWEELRPFVAQGQSVVIYHHADRSAVVDEQARIKLEEARRYLGTEPLGAVRSSLGSARLFLIVPSPRHAKLLRRRVDEMMHTDWRRILSLVA